MHRRPLLTLLGLWLKKKKREIKMEIVILLFFARCLHGRPPQGPVHRVPKAEGSGASRRVSPAGPVRQGAPQLSTLRGVTQEARGWGGRGAKPPHPRGPPPSSACDWLGGRECPPRRAGGSPWAPGGAGGAGRAGRAEQARGAGARVLGIAERAWGGRDSQRRGREPGGLSAEWRERKRESAGPSRRSARSRSLQSARPRSLPGGSGAAAGCSLTCRPYPAGRRRRTEGRGPATYFSRSQRLGPRAGCRLHGDRARGTRLRTFGRGGEFLPRALCGEGTGPLRCVRVPCQQWVAESG